MAQKGMALLFPPVLTITRYNFSIPTRSTSERPNTDPSQLVAKDEFRGLRSSPNAAKPPLQPSEGKLHKPRPLSPLLHRYTVNFSISQTTTFPAARSALRTNTSYVLLPSATAACEPSTCFVPVFRRAFLGNRATDTAQMTRCE